MTALLVLGALAVGALAIRTELRRVPSPVWARFRGLMRLPQRTPEPEPLNTAVLVLDLKRRTERKKS